MEAFDRLSIREINEELLDLQKTLESDGSINRINLHQKIRTIRASFRNKIAELSEALTGDRVYLPKMSKDR